MRPRRRIIGFPAPALASGISAWPARYFVAAVPRGLIHGFILSCASFPSRVLRASPAPGLPTESTFPGVSLPFATSTVESTSAGSRRSIAGVPSPLRSALDVSHALDGFLLHDLRGFVSPHCHVRDSLFRGFPSRGAARGFPRRCPRVGSRPLPTRFPGRQERPRRLQGLALRVSPLRDAVV